MFRVQYEYGEARGAVDRIPFQEEVKVLPKVGKVIVVMSEKAKDVTINYLRVEAVTEPQEDDDLYHILVRDHIQSLAPEELGEVIVESGGDSSVVAD